MKQKFAIGGSGSTYIYGLVDSLYREGMSRQECIDFVKKVISHAMARDGSSGGVIRLVIIDESGVEKEVVLGKSLMDARRIAHDFLSLLSSTGDQLPYLP